MIRPNEWTPEQERAFRQWYTGWAQKAGLDPDPDNPLHKYDYRAAYRAGATPQVAAEDGLYHWPSEFKSDDHPNRFVKGVDTKALDARHEVNVAPELLAKARAKVKEAKAAGFSDADIEQYLVSEIGVGMKAVMEPTGRDYARAGGMGASLGFLDELAGAGAAVVPGGKGYHQMRDEVRGNYDAALDANPKRMLAAEVAGGLLTTPIVPGAGASGAMAKAGRAAATSGLLGTVSGIGHSDAETLKGTAQDAAISGGLSAGAGGIASLLGSLASAAGRKAGDAMNPSRPIVRESATQIPANAEATIARQDALAPGSAVLADASPEMQALTRGVGADARTGVAARTAAEDRVGLIRTAMNDLGTKYDGLNRALPVDDQLKAALDAAGRGNVLKKGATEIDFAKLHKVRSNLLAEAKATKNSAVGHDKREAAAGITNWLKQHVPDVEQLDSDYAFLVKRLDAAKKTLREIAASSKNYAASRAYGGEAGSIGGSLPSGSRGVVMETLDKLFAPDRAARARAANELLLTPGDATSRGLSRVRAERTRMDAPPNAMLELMRRGLLVTAPTLSPHAGLLTP